VDELPDVVGEFAEGVVKWAYTNQVRYDVVHSHYWLSGWAGVLVKEALGIPLANSFHTLGRVKDATRRPDDPPSGLLRIATETGVIDSSDCVVASTPAEAEDLIEHYAATPERLCVSPPGIDHGVFTPGSRSDARRRLGIGGDPVLAFGGRIQPLKGADVAVEAASLLSGRFPDLTLVVVGGPSGPSGDDEMARLRRVSAAAGIEGQVEFRTPQPHGDLVDYYRAADVLVVPSRSESFGLVAVEAQACGTPVIAAEVGGLGFAVEDGESGYLIDGWDPASYAGAASAILGNAVLARRLSEGAIDLAARFSWPATVDRFLELYDGIIGNDAG
jgi:D-inositol-3-phosphate glycosyltransferase